MPYIIVNKTFPMYYEIEGEGEPIVFLHPPSMGHVTFSKQKPLTKEYKLITYDQRGNGRSSHDDKKVTISLLAMDLKYMLDELKIDKVVLVGYSSGSSIALEFALKFSERINGLVLCGGFSEVNSFLLKNQFKMGIIIAKYKRLSFLSNVLAISHSNNNEQSRMFKESIQKVNPSILKEMYEAGLQYNCTNELNEISAPILIVYGARDNYIHQYQHAFLNNHKNTSIVYVSNAKHQIPSKHAREFNEIIAHFMEKLLRGKAQKQTN